MRRAVQVTDWNDEDVLTISQYGTDEVTWEVSTSGNPYLSTADLERFAELLSRMVIDYRLDVDEAAELAERAKDAERCAAVLATSEGGIRCGLAPVHEDQPHQGGGLAWTTTTDPWFKVDPSV